MSSAVRNVAPWLAVGLFALSAVPTVRAATAPALDLAALEPTRFEDFVDGLMAAHLDDHHIAGAVIAVVHEGEVLLAKGYGWADVEARLPVDATSTLYRIGSVSKLFSWTAVMQLEEEGLLDLDADVNDYLDFTIPETFAEPVTLRHLMTHTAGFEDRLFDLFAARAVDLEPMGQWLAENIPARVRPPGVFSAYSNYGAALAGYIVERVSGLTWESYIEERILTPLEMSSTTPRQPPPPPLAGRLSRGYAFEDGRFVAQDSELLRGAAPAGSMSASAGDMARFMTAHLQGGRLGERRILSEEAAHRMRQRIFDHDPRLNGFAHGFYEMSSHGLRIVGHAGDTGWFHSLLALIPERALGLFVSYNSAGGGEIASGPVLEAVLDHLFPQPTRHRLSAAPASLERGRRVAGSYRSNRSSYTTFEKAVGLLSPVDVLAQPDGALVLRAPPLTRRFVETEPYLFTEVDGGPDRILFRQDAAGEIRWAFLDSMPILALEKLRWFERPREHRLLLAACGLVFAGVVVRALVVGLGRFRGRNPEPSSFWLTELSCAVVGLVFLGLFPVLLQGSRLFVYGEGLAALRFVLALPVLCAALAVVAVVRLVGSWKRWSLRRRAGSILLFVAAMLFVASVASWNLLPWRLG